MDIGKIQSILPQLPDFSKEEPAAPKEGGFASMLEKQLGEVNHLMQGADKKGQELAIGRTENLHEAMIGFEKAETALKLLMQVRNKALEAYNQVLSMQV